MIVHFASQERVIWIQKQINVSLHVQIQILMEILKQQNVNYVGVM